MVCVFKVRGSQLLSTLTVAPVKLPGNDDFSGSRTIYGTMNHPIVNTFMLTKNQFLYKLDRNSPTHFLFRSPFRLHSKRSEVDGSVTDHQKSLPRIHFGNQFTKDVFAFLTCCCCHWPSQFGATKISHWGKQS